MNQRLLNFWLENIANDQSNTNYDLKNESIYNTEVLKSNLCDYNDYFILVSADITAKAAPAAQVSFANCAPFTKCITKIDGTTIHDAKDLDLVMPMYNLIEYSSYYSKTTGNLWFYPNDKATTFNNNTENPDNFKSFKYKAKLWGNTVVYHDPNQANGILKNLTIAVLLKYLSNFLGSHEMPLVTCKIELKLKWTKYCFLFEKWQWKCNWQFLWYYFHC